MLFCDLTSWRVLLSSIILLQLVVAVIGTKKQVRNPENNPATPINVINKASLPAKNAKVASQLGVINKLSEFNRRLNRRRAFIERCCSNSRCDSSNVTRVVNSSNVVVLFTTLTGSETAASSGSNNSVDSTSTAATETSTDSSSTTTSTTPPTAATAVAQAQCPDIKCVVNVAQQNEFNNQKVWGLISTGYVIYLCDKKYIHYYIPASQADAYLNCCRMGLKLASIATMADLNCVRGNFNEQLTWVASSINGSVSNPRWCTGPGSYLLSELTQKVPLPGPGVDAINMRLSDATVMYDRASNLRWALCVDK